MSGKYTGGPAFPAKNYIIPKDLEDRHVHELGSSRGMTLRDYFAAKAMQGLLATGGNYADSELDGWRWHAKAAYAMADAMLAERDK